MLASRIGGRTGSAWTGTAVKADRFEKNVMRTSSSALLVTGMCVAGGLALTVRAQDTGEKVVTLDQIPAAVRDISWDQTIDEKPAGARAAGNDRRNRAGSGGLRICPVSCCTCGTLHRAAERNLEVHLHLPDACRVATDRDKVRLVLDNLLDNAVTYANAGGQLTISLEAADGHVKARIVNIGSCVSEKHAERVFNRFWRGDTSQTSDADARRCGLGLPLCRKLVNLLGGSISVVTTEGGTFAVTTILPR